MQWHFVIGLALGILIGCVIGWLAGSRGRGVAAPPDNRLENELRQQLTQREAELAKEREQTTKLNAGCAAFEAQKVAAEKLLAEQRQIHEQNLREARQAQEKALGDLREAFKALSADALKQTQPEFLRLAEQSFGKLQEAARGDLAQRQESIKTLVKPVEEQPKIYQQLQAQSETSQSTALGDME